MGVIYVLIPVAVLLTALGIYLFFWAVKTDQFDDLEKQGLSIFFDEDTKESRTSSEIEPEQQEEKKEANHKDKQP